MVMGLVSGLSLANHSDSESFLVVHTLFNQDGCQRERSWEVVRYVVSPFDLSWTLLCQGPAPAGSRGTLRMNGVGEWERVRQSLGLSLKFIFARPLYTLNIFWGEVHIAYTQVISKHYSNLTSQKQDVTHILFDSQESFWSFGLQAC